MEGPLKYVHKRKAWRDCYGRVEGGRLQLFESALLGEPVESVELRSAAVKRGLPDDCPKPPKDSADNAQFTVHDPNHANGPLWLSAATFTAASDWIAACKVCYYYCLLLIIYYLLIVLGRQCCCCGGTQTRGGAPCRCCSSRRSRRSRY